LKNHLEGGHMNVAFDQWIPVVITTGERKLVSLCNVLTEGEKFADLAVRPHERIALMRLFLCVSHAALNGPKDYDDWCAVPKQLPEAAQKYLTTWKDSFELFHETQPWLQVAALSKNAEGNVSLDDTDDWTPVSKLSFAYATGNNTTLFDHPGMSDNRSLALAETLLSMLTFQCFSPGGLISQVYWCGKQTGKSSKDGPCVSASMIHALLRDNNLLGTIHLNLPSYEDIHFCYGDRDSGKPVWELLPTSFADSVGIENATTTYVGRLVPMTRLIRIHPFGERMLLGDGLAYPSFSEGFSPEPTATVVVRKKKEKEERALLSFRPAKALWRELAAVIAKRKSEGLGGPLSLRAIQDGDDCDLIVTALARDKATIVDTIESVFHIPSKLRSPDGTLTYETEVKKADALSSRLGWAVETYRGEVDHGWEGKLKSAGPAKVELKAKLNALATNHYWTTIEKNLPFLMAHIEAIGTDALIPARDAWRKMLFVAACDAYRIVCGQETPRQIRAFAKGWSKLITMKDEHEGNETKEGNI
jgi:CRISPR system Cascade subunit CasA